MEILDGIKPSVYGDNDEKSTKTLIDEGLVGHHEPSLARMKLLIVDRSISMSSFGQEFPRSIEFASDIPKLCKHISDMLESQYCAQLDRHVHVKDLVHMNIKTVKGLKKIREKKLRDLKQGR